MSEDNNDELEQFRRQWQKEVSQRHRRDSKESTVAPDTSEGLSSPPKWASTSKIAALGAASARDNFQDSYVGGTYNFDNLEAREDARRLGTTGTAPRQENWSEPQSALEHFEHAVEKESQGNMQESLIYYRRAYKLDDRVDLAYRNKHFPPTKFRSKPTNVNPSNASVTVPNTAHHSLHGSTPGTLSSLVSSFADASIQPAIPEVEGAPQLPCPVATLPREILMAVMHQVAIVDVSSLVHLSGVCKQLAFLTHVEDSLWKTVCWESKHGFSDMHYSFSMTVKWQDLPQSIDDYLAKNMDSMTFNDGVDSPVERRLLPTLTPTYPTFLNNFHTRPRVRFSGIYISTVNYIRTGASSDYSVYWGNSPVHMVTYYRYLRFYRDGSAISLLTTFEPNEVVPIFHKRHLKTSKDGNTKDRLPNVPLSVAAGSSSATNQQAQGASTAAQPPTLNAVMRDVKRARWRLSPLHNLSPDGDGKESTPLEPEGNLYVETEGAAKHYTYHMQLALRSVRATGVALNTKLAWRSFWSHNLITDDWGEFNLRNDKPFVFSRVRSWVDA